MQKRVKVAVVTGGSKGIGHGIASVLAGEGFQVVITSRDLGRAQEAARSIQAGGVAVQGVALDLDQRSTFAPMLDCLLNEFGRIDVLVNNAVSQSIGAPFLESHEETIEAAITANITNVVLLTRMFYPSLKASHGNVINISSAVTERYLSGLPLYALYKGALNHMTRALAADWAPEVRVNAIMPGFIRSDAFHALGMPDEVIREKYEFYKSYVPMGIIGMPEDVGRLIKYVVSDDAGLMTGAVISLDGGFSNQGSPV